MKDDIEDVNHQAKRDWAQLPLNLFAAIILLLIAAISFQVFFSLFDINPIASFESKLPLIGKAITLNSLLDLQWHFLCIVGLLPAAIVWLKDGHVRVDFIYNRQSVRRKNVIELFGHLIFSVPFFVMAVPAAWQFMMSAYRSGQGSSNDGLNELFLVKATLPLGLGLIALVLAWDFYFRLQALWTK